MSSGVDEKVEDVGTKEPAVTGIPVFEAPVAFEEHLAVTHTSSDIPQAVFTPTQISVKASGIR